MDDNTVAELFKECDVHDHNYLEPLDLHRVCPQLTNDELQYIFDQLDVNKDGKVTKDEFIAGFVRALHAGESAGFSGIRRRASVVLNDCPMPVISSSSSPPPEIIRSSSNISITLNGSGQAKKFEPRSSTKRKNRTDIPKVVYNLEPDANLEVIPWYVFYCYTF